MCSRGCSTSSWTGALGQSSFASPEGTSPDPLCQRGQPSTSTFGSRVASRDGALRDCDVQVVRPARGGEGQAGDDAVGDRDLQAQVDRCAEPDLEAAPQPERDL